MSDHVGEKTEQPTPRRLEDAIKRGQFPHSAEVQTVCVLLGGTIALMLFGRQCWQDLARSFEAVLGHLHEMPLNPEMLRLHLWQGVLVVAGCTGPVMVAGLVGGLLAGGLQSQFHTTPEAMSVDWSRLSPVNGFQRVFSLKSLTPTVLALVKLSVICVLSWSVVKQVFHDPIFYTAVDAARVAQFLGAATLKILLWVGGAMLAVAAADYAYQFWQTRRDLMMTREELKEELKHSEGNPHIKARQRRRRTTHTLNKMLAEVPKADVIVRNPTRFAVALRYDRRAMRAPKIVAKGARWNARRILEIAEQHQVPTLENQPLARLLYKHGRVGSEIPVQFYTAVAEILAWVYRTNRYRYYTEQNTPQPEAA